MSKLIIPHSHDGGLVKYFPLNLTYHYKGTVCCDNLNGTKTRNFVNYNKT